MIYLFCYVVLLVLTIWLTHKYSIEPFWPPKTNSIEMKFRYKWMCKYLGHYWLSTGDGYSCLRCGDFEVKPNPFPFGKDKPKVFYKIIQLLNDIFRENSEMVWCSHAGIPIYGWMKVRQ